MVCFNSDYQPQFKELSRKKSAVKLTQFCTSNRFGRLDLILDKKTKVSEVSNKLSFKPIKGLDLKDNVDKSNISELANMERITIKAKLCQVSGVKVRVTHFGQLKSQTGYIIYPSRCVKIVFWKQFTEVAEQGKTF